MTYQWRRKQLVIGPAIVYQAIGFIVFKQWIMSSEYNLQHFGSAMAVPTGLAPTLSWYDIQEKKNPMRD